MATVHFIKEGSGEHKKTRKPKHLKYKKLLYLSISVNILFILTTIYKVTHGSF